MTQHDRDFQKVLQALTVFDKKLSTLEDVVRQLAEANVNYATSQQELNKEQSELKSHFLQRYEDILDEQHRLETQLCVFQNEMLHSFELCFRYYKTKKKGFK